MDDWEEKIDEEPRFEMPSNKWEGEDEDEEVLDSWEDINEEKKDVEKPPEVPKGKPKPKKKLADIIEEKERKAREEAERRAAEKEENMTPEERRAEALRRKELVEQSDLRVTMDTFGVDKNSINMMFPTNPEEFKEFHDAVFQKINQFSKHVDFPNFAEELIKSICITLNTTSLRKVKTTVESLHGEKLKMEKEKVKKNKGKGKAKLKVEGESEYGDLAAYDANDYDDFM